MLNVVLILFNGIVYLLLILLTLSIFVNSILTLKDKAVQNSAILFFMTFLTCWNLLYIHPLWNSFFLHTLLAYWGSNLLMGRFRPSRSPIPKRLIGFLSITALISIWIVNQCPLFIENVIASDSYWSFATTQKWYRWALWILAVISVLHYWGARLQNWYRLVSENRRIKKTFLSAERHRSQKNYRLAIDEYRAVLNMLSKASIALGEKNRYNGEAHLGLGHALWQSKLKSTGLTHYEQAKRFSKVDDLSLNRLARSLFDKQQYQAVYSLLTTYSSQLPDTQMLFGRCCLKLNKLVETIELLQKLCRKDGYGWEAHYYLGCAYGRQESYADAIGSFASAATLAPRQSSVYLQRGHAFFKSGQFEQARQDYLKSEELGNRSEELSFALVALMIETGQLNNAAARLTSIKPQSKYHEISTLLLGLSYERQGSLTEASSVYESALWNGSNSAGLKTRLGWVYVKVEDFEKAERLLTDVMHAGIDDDVILYDLGWVCYRQTKLQECVTYWAKLNQRCPRNRKLKDQLGQVYYQLACIHAQDKDFDSAVMVLSEYQKQLNKEVNPMVAVVLAEIYFQAASIKARSKEESEKLLAKEYLNQAHQLNPEDIRFSYYLALAEAEHGKLTNSADLLQSITGNQNNRKAAYQLALCHTAVGDTKLALEVLESLSKENGKDSVAQKASLSLAAIKMQVGDWSNAADLLLDSNHREK